MKKISIILLHLNHGGIEKQTITMANELSKNYEIEIISVYDFNNVAYKINDNIKVKYLTNLKPNKDVIIKFLKLKKFYKLTLECIKSLKILITANKNLKKFIKKSDSDIIFTTRIKHAEILSKYGNSKKIRVTQEHNYVSDKRTLKKYKKISHKLDNLVLMTQISKNEFKKYFPVEKIKVIPNMLDKIPKKKSTLNNNTILGVGRLHPVKAFDEMIEVFNIVCKTNNKLKLKIVGDGSERAKLQKIIDNYKLNDKVVLTGMLSAQEVENEMLNSSLYLMTSLRECFPMVILESNACGVPVISYKIKSGPLETIKNGYNGYLVKNLNREEMAKKIIDYFSNNNKIVFSNNCREFSNNFLSSRVVDQWKEIFK